MRDLIFWLIGVAGYLAAGTLVSYLLLRFRQVDNEGDASASVLLWPGFLLFGGIGLWFGFVWGHARRAAQRKDAAEVEEARVARGVTILSTYSSGDYKQATTKEVFVAGAAPTSMRAEDVEELRKLGWRWDKDIEVWVRKAVGEQHG